MKQTLKNIVGTRLLDNSMQYGKNTLLGLCALALVGGCAMTPEGKQFSRDMFGHYIQENISKDVWTGQENVNTQTNTQGSNNCYIPKYNIALCANISETLPNP